MRNCDETDMKINDKIITEIMNRYSKRLEVFEELVMTAEPIRRVDLVE